MKKKSHILFWLLSPTYKIAEINKWKILEGEGGKAGVTESIKRYNRRYLFSTIGLAIIVAFLFDQRYCLHDYYKYINYSVYFFIDYLILFSRGFEIFKAFLDDAVEKLNREESSSALNYGDRLRLAFNSYIELMIGFGVLYYTLPLGLFKGGSSQFAFSGVIEAIYFSGVTMATVGYGDISPANWLTQCLVIFQVFCGLTLALVSFTVYTSLALAGSKIPINRTA